MGLFNTLGRKVEEFKQDVDSAKTDEATHRCADCERLFYTEHETCPECGSESVVER